MNPQDPATLYMVLILPTLFAFTLITEGMHKLLKKEPGWLSFALGMAFLFIAVFAYFEILSK